MSVEALKKQTGLASVPAQTKSLTVFDMLTKYKDQIALALPKHMSADRMARIAMTEIRKNPQLGKCTPESLMGSVIILSQLGLEPGVMGQAYLISYHDNKKDVDICTAVPGWQGMVDLVSRAGRATIHTDAVHDGDEFEYAKGTSPFIKHIEHGDGTGKFTHVYAVGRVKGAEFPIIEIWSRAKVEAHLKSYNKVGNRHYALTNENNLEMYGRKGTLLQVLKYLPKSVELAQAADLSYGADTGTQNISIQEAVAGTFDASGSYPTIDGGSEDSPRVRELLGMLGLSAEAESNLRSHSASEDDLIANLEQLLERDPA